MTRVNLWATSACWIALLAFGALVQPADGAAQGQLVMKVATPHHPSSPWGRALDRFAQYVHEATRQRIRVRVFYEGALGASRDVVTRVVDGSLQAYAGPLDGWTTQAPALAALEAPYLFRTNVDAARKLAEHRERLQSVFNNAGLHLAQWQPEGFRQRFTTDTGEVQSTTFANAFVRGVDRRTRHVTLTNDSLELGALVYSRRWFEGLPAQTQALLTRLPDATKPGDRTTLEHEVDALETHLLDAIKQRGVVVHELSLAELNKAQREAIDAHLKTLTDAGRALYRQLTAP